MPILESKVALKAVVTVLNVTMARVVFKEGVEKGKKTISIN